MSDVMFYGVLRMPYQMAMDGEISRNQFYQRAQEAADRVERAEARVAELEANLAKCIKRNDELIEHGALKAIELAEARALAGQQAGAWSEEIGGVNVSRLLRNLEETSHNEDSVDLACRCTDALTVIKALLAAAPAAPAAEPVQTNPMDLKAAVKAAFDGVVDSAVAEPDESEDFHNGKIAGILALKRAILAAPSPAHEGSEEDAYVIDRLGKLLAGVAIALNGPEPERTRWSYHDLPEKAGTLMLELEIFRAMESDKAPQAQESVRYADGVPGELVGWQWREKGARWDLLMVLPERQYPSDEFEVRSLWAGPVESVGHKVGGDEQG